VAYKSLSYTYMYNHQQSTIMHILAWLTLVVGATVTLHCQHARKKSRLLINDFFSMVPHRIYN